jgi:hypothetical protein
MSLDDIESAWLFITAGFWPTVAVNDRQLLLATLSRILENRALDEETREQVVQQISGLVAWLHGQLGKEKGA